MSTNATEAPADVEPIIEPSTGENTDTTSEPSVEPLGEAGMKALAAEREARKVAEKRIAEAEAKAAEMQAKLDGREAEFKAEQDAQAVKNDALAHANARILKAEIRAAAAGKLADPADALAFIATTDFEVSDDGSVDADAITAAIAELIERKPHLAARSGATTPRPDASQGATKSTPGTTGQQFAAAFNQAL